MTTVAAIDLVPIPNLGPCDPLDGTELIIAEQDGVTRRTTAQDVANLAAGTGGAISFTGKSAVAVAAGNTDDWSPTLTGISRLEVTAAGPATITGLVGGTDGRLIVVTNVGANDVTLMAQDPGSAAAHRFASNGDTLLMSGWSASFIYSAALSRWTRMN